MTTPDARALDRGACDPLRAFPALIAAAKVGALPKVPAYLPSIVADRRGERDTYHDINTAVVHWANSAMWLDQHDAARDTETGDRIATGLRLIDILEGAKQEAGVTGFMLGHIALWLAEAETGQPE